MSLKSIKSASCKYNNNKKHSAKLHPYKNLLIEAEPNTTNDEAMKKKTSREIDRGREQKERNARGREREALSCVSVENAHLKDTSMLSPASNLWQIKIEP